MDEDTLHNTIDDQSDGIPTVSATEEQQTVPVQQEDASATEPAAKPPRTVAEDPLQIAFSVYTATNGYDWSNIPEGNEHDELNYFYQKAVVRKPDFMSPGDVVKGVFACNGIIAAFRIQVVKHWDSFGRNADYCAFAFLTYQEAYKVDFEALLAMPEFTDPRHDPPTSISYSGEASKDINSEGSVATIKKLYNGESLQSFDFAKIGALLSAHGNNSASWLFCKVECAIENSTTVSTGAWNADPYPPPPPPPPPPPQPESTTGVQLSEEQPIAPGALPEISRSFPAALGSQGVEAVEKPVGAFVSSVSTGNRVLENAPLRETAAGCASFQNCGPKGPSREACRQLDEGCDAYLEAETTTSMYQSSGERKVGGSDAVLLQKQPQNGLFDNMRPFDWMIIGALVILLVIGVGYKITRSSESPPLQLDKGDVQNTSCARSEKGGE